MSILSKALAGLSLVLVTGLVASPSEQVVSAPAEQTAPALKSPRNLNYMVNMLFPLLCCQYTDAQLANVKVVSKSYMSHYWKGLEKLHDLKQTHLKIKADPNSSPALIKAAFDAAVKQEVLLETLDHQLLVNLRKLLTPEQLKTFEKMAPRAQAYLAELTRHDLVFWRLQAGWAINAFVYTDQQYEEALRHLKETNATIFGPLKQQLILSRRGYENICKPGVNLSEIEKVYKIKGEAEFEAEVSRYARIAKLDGMLTPEQKAQAKVLRDNERKFTFAFNSSIPKDFFQAETRADENNLVGNRARILALLFDDEQFKKVSDIATKYQDDKILLMDANQTSEDKYMQALIAKSPKEVLKPLYDEVLKTGFEVEKLNLQTETTLQTLLGDKVTPNIEPNLAKVMKYHKALEKYTISSHPGGMSDPNKPVITEPLFAPTALNALAFNDEQLKQAYGIVQRANQALKPIAKPMHQYQAKFNKMVLDINTDQFDLGEVLTQLCEFKYSFNEVVDARSARLEKLKPAGHDEKLKKMAARINEYMKLFS